jgi:ABC-type nitrate/sulfonate/bicarbonate transport system substrate-binding protein
MLGLVTGIVFLIVVSFGVKGSLPAANRESGSAAQTIVIKWNGPLNVAAAGLVLGVNDGLFQEVRLSPRLEAGADDEEVARAVAASDQVIGHVSAMGFLRARAAGLPVVAIAASYIANSVRLFVLDATVLRSPSDLVGKSLACKSSSEVGLVVEALISRNGVQRSLVKVTDASSTVSQLISGAVDVLPGYQEIEGTELRSLNVSYRTLDPGAFGIHIPGSVYIVSAQMLANSSSVAEAFVSALLASWARADLSPNRTAEIIAKALGGSARPQDVIVLLEQQRDLIRPFGARMAELDLARWQDFQKLLLQQRWIADPVNLRAAIDFALVPDVYRKRSRSMQAD